jgi:hypothetical protein
MSSAAPQLKSHGPPDQTIYDKGRYDNIPAESIPVPGGDPLKNINQPFQNDHWNGNSPAADILLSLGQAEPEKTALMAETVLVPPKFRKCRSSLVRDMHFGYELAQSWPFR